MQREREGERINCWCVCVCGYGITQNLPTYSMVLQAGNIGII